MNAPNPTPETPPAVPKEKALRDKTLTRAHVTDFQTELAAKLLALLAEAGHVVKDTDDQRGPTIDRYWLASLVTIKGYGSVPNRIFRDRKDPFLAQSVEVRTDDGTVRRLKADGSIDLAPIVAAIGAAIARRLQRDARHASALAFAKELGLANGDRFNHTSWVGGAQVYFTDADKAQVTVQLDPEKAEDRAKLAQLVALFRSWDEAPR
jgi:hypothetical protein